LGKVGTPSLSLEIETRCGKREQSFGPNRQGAGFSLEIETDHDDLDLLLQQDVAETIPERGLTVVFFIAE
jgi:hypothetical protein